MFFVPIIHVTCNTSREKERQRREGVFEDKLESASYNNVIRVLRDVRLQVSSGQIINLSELFAPPAAQFPENFCHHFDQAYSTVCSRHTACMSTLLHPTQQSVPFAQYALYCHPKNTTALANAHSPLQSIILRAVGGGVVGGNGDGADADVGVEVQRNCSAQRALLQMRAHKTRVQANTHFTALVIRTVFVLETVME